MIIENYLVLRHNFRLARKEVAIMATKPRDYVLVVRTKKDAKPTPSISKERLKTAKATYARLQKKCSSLSRRILMCAPLKNFLDSNSSPCYDSRTIKKHLQE